MNSVIYLNNKKILIQDNLYTVLQQCELLNIVVPRFCYHEKLSIAGNCRICLVEINNSFKLIVACATMATNNMVINTINNAVKNARENIIEFLLINHPLDCPICDQGGECDLQDQTLLFGRDRSRFKEIKKTVFDKNFSPFIKTIMTRCIHCTRCIRYFSEILGYPILGTVGRGFKMEISNYMKSKDLTELSGNVIDVCPVGAITSKPFSFSARAWEFINIETIDLLDSFCSGIRVNLKADTVMRILPSIVNKRNQFWITNKIRFAYDSLRIQRIYDPKIISNKLIIDVSWKKVFKYIKYNLYKFMNTYDFQNHFYAYSGKFMDLESLLAFKFFSKALDISNINLDVQLDNDFYKSYLLNSSKLVDINDTQLFLLYGINTKLENSMINLKIRKLTLESSKEVQVFYIGNKINLNYEFTHIGLTMITLFEFYYGTTYLSYHVISTAVSTFFSGIGAFNSDFNTQLIADLLKLNLYKNINYQYNNLFTGNTSILDLNITSKIYSKLFERDLFLPKFIYFFGYENYHHFNVNYKNIFIIYHGHHYDAMAKKATVLLPSPTFFEYSGIFLDCDGLIHHSNSIEGATYKFKDNFFVLNALLKYLSFDMKELSFINKINSSLLNTKYNIIAPLSRNFYHTNISLDRDFSDDLIYLNNIRYDFIEDAFFNTYSRNFYNMDVFSKNSITIAKYQVLTNTFSNF